MRKQIDFQPPDELYNLGAILRTKLYETVSEYSVVCLPLSDGGSMQAVVLNDSNGGYVSVRVDELKGGLVTFSIELLATSPGTKEMLSGTSAYNVLENGLVNHYDFSGRAKGAVVPPLLTAPEVELLLRYFEDDRIGEKVVDYYTATDLLLRHDKWMRFYYGSGYDNLRPEKIHNRSFVSKMISRLVMRAFSRRAQAAS